MIITATNKEEREMVAKEADFLRSLTSVHVPELFGLIFTSGLGLIVQVKVNGVTLKDYVQTHEDQIPYEDAKQMFRGLVRSVSFLHRRNVAHLDLKPENIMRKLDDTLTVIDMGMALTGPDVRRNAWQGTLKYLAPELYSKVPNNILPEKVDIYGIGLVTYYLFTKQFAYEEENDGLVMEEKKMNNVMREPLLERMNGNETDFICRLLHANPDQRPTISQITRSTFYRTP